MHASDAFAEGSKKPNGDTARESSLSWELFYQVWDVRLREQTSATEKQREQETEREAEVDGGESKRGRERRAVGDGAGVSLRNQRVEGERAKGMLDLLYGGCGRKPQYRVGICVLFTDGRYSPRANGEETTNGILHLS